MKRLLALLGGIALTLAASHTYAAGTLAGLPVTNQATAEYGVGGVPGVITPSNIVTFNVDELINVNVTGIFGPVQVTSPQTDAADPLPFVAYDVTNTGNGPEDFLISLDAARPGDDFNPIVDLPSDVFVDTNGNGTFEPGTDLLFSVATPISLDPDETLRFFVRAEIPTGFVDGNTGLVNLQADTQTGGLAGGTPGDSVGGAGEGGTTAVVGTTQGTGNADQTFVVAGITVSIDKSVFEVNDRLGPIDGSGQPTDVSGAYVPGAYVTYLLEVEVSGSGAAAAEDLLIRDVIPAAATSNVAYVQESIRLVVNGGGSSGQTDEDNIGVDNTRVEFVGSPTLGAGLPAPDGATVFVNLGTVTPNGVTQTYEIYFDVEIQ